MFFPLILFGGVAAIGTAIAIDDFNNSNSTQSSQPTPYHTTTPSYNQPVYTPKPYYNQPVYTPTLIKAQVAAPLLSSKPASSLAKEVKIKIGPMGEEIYLKVKNGNHYYVKRNLTLVAIENYKWAMMEKVGPPIEINYSEVSVTIERGINPREAIKRGMISKQNAISQVQNLQAILRNNKKAHCDVKMDNCLYFVNYGQIFLIDNGEITDYDLLRPVKTDGENTTVPGKGQISGIVGYFTDEKGFKNIIEALSSA